jgi:small-conductance mechanosensitive channel
MRPPNPLDWEYYHNTVREWLVALGILASVFVVLVVIRQLARRRLAKGVAPPFGSVFGGDSVAAAVVRRTRFFFFFACGLAAAAPELTLAPGLEQGIHDIAVVAVLLQIGMWCDAIIGFALNRYVARRSTPSGDEGEAAIAASRTTVAALGAVARVVLWILLALVALDSLGVHVTTLVAGLGVTGIALALAVQNILGDLFGALAIVLDKPFVVGDGISVDGLSGTVEHIGLKTTRVRANTGEQIVFSNADLLKSRIRNFRRLRERTVILTVTVDQSSPTDAVARIPSMMHEIIDAQPGVRFSRSHVTAPSDRGIPIETVYVVLSADYGQFMDVQQAITVGLLRRLRDAGVALATSGGVTVVREGGTPTVRAVGSAPAGSPRGGPGTPAGGTAGAAAPREPAERAAGSASVDS